MSAHNDSHESQDPVEAVVKHIPVVIPVVGAVSSSCWRSLPFSWPKVKAALA